MRRRQLKSQTISNVAIAVIMLTVIAAARNTYACSTAYVPESSAKLMGKNYVWHYGPGRVVLNRKGMAKTALVEEKLGNTAHHWKALYPSLTFNQIANDFPNGGMNSEGLAVEILLAAAEYPRTSSLPVVSELQWIQYLLDTSATVEEAIRNAKAVDIVPLSGYRVHYHVCDRHSECAVFEYANQKLQVFDSGSEGRLPMGVNNSSYFRQPTFLSDPPAQTPTADKCEATRLLVSSISDFASPDPDEQVTAMFDLMQRLNRDPQWQIVYELANGKIHFRTQVGGMNTIRHVDFADINATEQDCTQVVYVDQKSGKKFVRKPLAYDLAVKKNATEDHPVLSTNLRTSLVIQSQDFLKPSGISKKLIRKLFDYPGEHTVCLIK